MPSSEEIDDAELAQRRERGRLAQRAFRRRQIDTIRELREDNQALRDAIDQISRAAATGPASQARQAELQNAIENAFRVAGLDPSLARSLAEASDVDDEEVGLAGLSSANSMLVSTAMSYPGVSAVDFSSLSAPLLSAPAYSQLPVASVSSPPGLATSSSGRMSPRLTYGLWFEPDRAIRIVHPPRDIAPYVGDGMGTLSGAIFWTGMGYSLNALRTVLNARFRGVVIDPNESSSDDESDGGGDEFSPSFPSSDTGAFRLSHQPVDDGRLVLAGSHDDDDGDDEDSSEANTAGPRQTPTQQILSPAPRPSAPKPSQQRQQQQKARRYRRRVRQAQQAVTRMFGPTLRLVSDRALYDIIHARFAWRNKGWIAGDHPGRDPEAPMRLFAAILRDLDHSTAFGEPHMWMTPVDIEAYVQQRLRLTPASWEPWAAALQGRGTPARTEMVRRLVDAVALSGMCFGDGPRFRPEQVKGTVEAWINGAAVGVEGVGYWL